MRPGEELRHHPRIVAIVLIPRDSLEVPRVRVNVPLQPARAQRLGHHLRQQHPEVKGVLLRILLRLRTEVALERGVACSDFQHVPVPPVAQRAMIDILQLDHDARARGGRGAEFRLGLVFSQAGNHLGWRGLVVQQRHLELAQGDPETGAQDQPSRPRDAEVVR